MPHKSIEIIVRGVWIVDRQVLICRNRQAGHGFLPGGHVEFGEPARTALEREIHEETGLTLHAGRFIGACEASFDQPTCKRRKAPGRTHHEINLVFELSHPASQVNHRRQKPGSGRRAALPPVVSIEDHIEFLWVPLPDLARPESAVPLLPQAICSIVGGSNPGRGPSRQRAGVTPAWVMDWQLAK